MERIVDLLFQKNHFLEKFYSLNESEIKKFAVGNFDQIEIFYQNRERLLEIMHYIDAQIESETALNEMNYQSASVKEQVREALLVKDEFVHRILHQDLEILSFIEIAKSNIIKELSDIQKSKKAVRGYKSPTFSKRVNEEI